MVTERQKEEFFRILENRKKAVVRAADQEKMLEALVELNLHLRSFAFAKIYKSMRFAGGEKLAANMLGTPSPTERMRMLDAELELHRVKAEEGE